MDETSLSPRAEDRLVASTQDLQTALDRQTALLHEVDHRVKNNLQLISSLFLLQVRRTGDPAVRTALTGMLSRVNAVATVHRRLFQGEDVERFDVAQFVRDLVSDVIGGSGRSDIEVSLELERVDVAASKAAPLALVINELLSNALLHGYPDGRRGRISIIVARDGADFRIEVADDGVGMDEDEAETGLGLTIVHLLCQQLRARCDVDTAGPGVRILILLPVNGVH